MITISLTLTFSETALQLRVLTTNGERICDKEDIKRCYILCVGGGGSFQPEDGQGGEG